MTARFSALRCTLLLGALLGVSVGCAERPLPPPAAPLTPPTRLCGPNEGPPACRGPSDIEQLQNAALEILAMDDTPNGIQGAKLLTLLSGAPPGGVVLRAKWRPQSARDGLNDPRKELAAYAVQRLFLDESQEVVPPTTAHCFPGQMYRRFVPDARTSVPGVDCVLGYLEYWLEGSQTAKHAQRDGLLKLDDGMLDARRFAGDAAYRDSVSNSNLLTYLVNNGDAHPEQFVVQQSPRGLRMFVVDNSMALGGFKNPVEFFRHDWSRIQVPALPPPSIERLRQLTAADLARLGVINELAREGDTLVPVAPGEPTRSDDHGLSWDGSHLRIGLTHSEIALVADRVRELLERKDLDTLTRR